MESTNTIYQIKLDEIGVYTAHSSLYPGVFVEAVTLGELETQISQAEADLKEIKTDRPAIRSRFDDLARQLLTDYGFVNRGAGRGEYELWARANHFLTVPTPIHSKRMLSLIVSYAFRVWRQENGIK